MYLFAQAARVVCLRPTALAPDTSGLTGSPETKYACGKSVCTGNRAWPRASGTRLTPEPRTSELDTRSCWIALAMKSSGWVAITSGRPTIFVQFDIVILRVVEITTPASAGSASARHQPQSPGSYAHGISRRASAVVRLPRMLRRRWRVLHRRLWRLWGLGWRPTQANPPEQPVDRDQAKKDQPGE